MKEILSYRKETSVERQKMGIDMVLERESGNSYSEVLYVMTITYRLIRFRFLLPHEIKEFIDSIGLSESDVMGISCIAKKTFSNPSISYAVDVDEDDVKYLSVTIFDDSDDVNEKDSHIESFYKAVNFDKRWQNFFSKSVVYFK